MIDEKSIKPLIVMSLLLTTLMGHNTVNATELSVTDENRLLGAIPESWESANLREWLNSDKATVKYTAIAPTYKNEVGFLSDKNFTQEERDAIAVTRHGGAWQYSLEENVSDTIYISQRKIAHNDYVYNDKVFILNFTDLVNYIERNKELMNLNTKHYSNYLQNTTNKQDKYPYIVNSGYVNYFYYDVNEMYSSVITPVYGLYQNNIVPALSLKPNYVLSNGVQASDLRVGQTVTFGKYNGEAIEWQVINVSDEGYPLLWSTKIITVKEYDAPGDINPLKSNYINFNSYDVDIESGIGQSKSWETQKTITSYPTISILNEEDLITPTNDTKITIRIKATDTNHAIRHITLPDGTVVQGDTASYTITKNGEFDIIAENSEGVMSVRHVITKAINTPAEITITSDKASDSKWTNKPVNVTITSTNKDVYEKTTPSKETGPKGVFTTDFESWLPLGGKRMRVTGTLYNKIKDEDIEKYGLDMNATIRLGFYHIRYSSSERSWTYPAYKTITLQELKDAGSIEIDEVFTLPNSIYSNFYIYLSLMSGYSPWMKPGYNWGASEFNYEILDKDDLKIGEITLPDGSIVKNDSANYKIFETGSYTFKATDNRGKTTSETIEIAIDMDNPQADIVYTQNPTKENVVLQINATDALSGIKSIKLPNGESRTNTTDGKPLSTTYNIIENGTYTFTITDFAGNQITKTANVTNIDRNVPTISVTQNTTEWTNQDVTLTIKATDDESGIKQIELPNGTVVKGASTTYTVTENGKYTFKATDKAGNEINQTVNVKNIDKTKPTINISGVPESLTHQNVRLTITATDNESGVKSITLPNGLVVNGSSATYTAKGNDDYTFKVTDHAGNTSTQTINIDIPVLTSQANPSKNMIRLDWKLNNADDKTFRIYQKKPGSSEFQTISATNLSSGKQVKVLNLYPDAGETISCQTWDGESVSVKKAGSLKCWIESPNSESDKGYGKGLIEVSPVSINEFNSNPTQYLTKTNGEWNYDVIMIGSWDVNNSQDINDIAIGLVRTFIEDGKGVLVGHDTIGYVETQPNLRSLSDYLNMQPTGGLYYNGYDEDGTTLEDYSLKSNIKIVKKGLLTNYPWVIGNVNSSLTVPITHSLGQIANGDIWMRFNYKEMGLTDPSNFYLTTWNNVAMIQTGHANGTSMSDEQKVLVNTLFYLNQLSSETYLEDYSGQDINAPNTPKINDYSFTSNGYINFNFDAVTDNGSTYEYYVESTSKDSDVAVKSNTITDTITSGIKGYSYVIDNHATTIPDDTIEQSDNATIKYKYSNTNNLYVHIKAIDNAGNASETHHYKLVDNTKPIINSSQTPTTWTNGTVTIKVTATDTGSGVKSITLPDGKVVEGSTATYAVTVNGDYTFEATDYVGNVATHIVSVTNIDKSAPVITYSLTPNTWTNGHVTINLTATDDVGIKEIMMPNGQVVSGSTASYTVTKNGVYYFKAVDNAGNETVLPILVTNIDVKAPEVIIHNNENWTNQDVQISITGTD